MDPHAVGRGLDRGGSGQGQVAGTCECGKETSGSIKCGEFDWLRTGQLLKKDCASWSKAEVHLNNVHKTPPQQNTANLSPKTQPIITADICANHIKHTM